MKRNNGLWYSAEYATFSITDEVGKYQLTVAGYSGDAGDAIADADWPPYGSNGMMFSTLDSDNDNWPAGSCAVGHQSGWWHNWCTSSELSRDKHGRWETVDDRARVKASRMLVKLAD